ncbi:DUF3422 family protein [Falsihalocynthiibacter sp. SS001]|uniref:DUF3422 family protein n=1 Tax=Falsihalocynthiibacter sp. SS001 TaxID=3349698 RepID=UPI0036D2FD90
MSPLKDHPQRFQLSNALHARPFPAFEAPAQVAFLTLLTGASQTRDMGREHEHLIALLDRYGAAHPTPDAPHYFGTIGRHQLRWESHSEFVTYTIITKGSATKPFEFKAFDVFPQDWLAEAPGERITSGLIHVAHMPEIEKVTECLAEWFVPESLAVSHVLDHAAVMASDFRIDEGGHVRYALFVQKDVGMQRVGRILQRICEIETYKTAALLGYLRAQVLMRDLGVKDEELAELVRRMSEQDAPAEETLAELMKLAAWFEKQTADVSYRFGATIAYGAIVNQRISVLREERFLGRQTFAEFMMRRFDPAMRTTKAASRLLQSMSDRALRAGELLRTRVDVVRSAQNQAILRSMDRRADLQLRLQETVEGLSVVAVSYYGVNLLTYVLSPFAKHAGIDKVWLTAILVPFVVLGVWSVMRRIKSRISGANKK